MSFNEILEQFDKALISENVKLKKIYNTLLRESEENKPEDDKKKEEKPEEQVVPESCGKVDENDPLNGNVHNGHKEVTEKPVTEAEKKDDDDKKKKTKPAPAPVQIKLDDEEEKKDDGEGDAAPAPEAGAEGGAEVAESLPIKKFFEESEVTEKVCPKCGKEVPDGKECGDGECCEKPGLTPEQFYALKEKKEAKKDEAPVEGEPAAEAPAPEAEPEKKEEEPAKEAPAESPAEEPKKVEEAGGVKTATKAIKDAPEVLEICKKMEDQELAKVVARFVMFDKYGNEGDGKPHSPGTKELEEYAQVGDFDVAMAAMDDYVGTPELKNALMAVGYTEADAERRSADASIQEGFLTPTSEANMKSEKEAGLKGDATAEVPAEKPADPEVAGKTASEELPPDGEEALKETGVGATNPDPNSFFGTGDDAEGAKKEENPEEAPEKKPEDEEKKEEVAEAEEIYETEVVEDPEADAALEESIKNYMKNNSKYFS